MMVDIKMPPEGWHWEEIPCPHRGLGETCFCSEFSRKELVEDRPGDPGPVY